MKPMCMSCWLFASAILVAQAAPHFGAEPRALAELVKAKRNLAKKWFEVTVEADLRKPIDSNEPVHVFDEASEWSKRWADADQELATTLDEKIRAAEEHIERLNKMFKIADNRREAGAISIRTVESLEYDRLEAQIALLKLKDQKK